jgi:5-methylcytosine-specific restriction protein A
MAREVKEWIGRTNNSMPTPQVRQRIWDRFNGHCGVCGLPLVPGETWDADHIIALKDNGENRESNIQPAHPKCHRIKTAQEAIERAPVERKKQKHSGARPQSKKTFNRPPKEAKPRKPAVVRKVPLYRAIEQ